MRVFLDANVLFSASKAGGHISRLVDRLLRSGEAVTSDLAREEARRNVALKRPAWLDEFNRLLGRVQVVGSVVFTLRIALDAKDVAVLCAAIRARCEYFVTGDRRDFGHLHDTTVNGLTVITLLRLAELLGAPGQATPGSPR